MAVNFHAPFTSSVCSAHKVSFSQILKFYVIIYRLLLIYALGTLPGNDNPENAISALLLYEECCPSFFNMFLLTDMVTKTCLHYMRIDISAARISNETQ